MIYKDHDSNPKQFAILLLAIGVMYLFCLRLPLAGEVSSLIGFVVGKLGGGSGVNATPSLLMDNMQDACYPLKIYLASLFSVLPGAVTELSARLPALFSCLVLGLSAAWVSNRLFGINTFLVALAVVVTMPISMQVAVDADGNGVFALLLGGAWGLWYYYGWRRNCWGRAWLFSLALVTIAVFERGLLAYLYFYLPLMFLRSPIRSWSRIKQPLHLLWLVISLALFSAWYSLIAPESLPLVEVGYDLIENGSMGENYISRLFLFPLLFLLLLMPWPIITWPAYCAEFQPLEKHPEIMHYLRTIVLSVFLFNWLLPVFDVTDLYLAAAPVAILSACHYEVLMRRYRPIYMLCAKVIYAISAISAFVLAIGLIFYLYGVIDIENIDVYHYTPVIYVPIAVFAAVYLFWKLKGAFPVWLHLSLAVCLALTVCISGWGIMEEAKSDFRKTLVQQLTSEIPAGETIYKLNKYSMSKYASLFDHPVKLLSSASDIPEKENGVYVLGDAKPPMKQELEWTAISPQVIIPSRLRWQVSKSYSDSLWFYLSLKGGDDKKNVTRKVRMYEVTVGNEE